MKSKLLNLVLIFISGLIIIPIVIFHKWNMRLKNFPTLENISTNFGSQYSFNIFKPLSSIEIQQYLKVTFPNADSFRINNDEIVQFYEAYSKNTKVGIVGFIEKDVPCPKCTDIRFMIGIDQQNKINRITLINNFDYFGQKMEAKTQDEFLNQFLGKSIKKAFFLNKNVNAITGATSTSRYFIDGLNEFLFLLNAIYDE